MGLRIGREEFDGEFIGAPLCSGNESVSEAKDTRDEVRESAPSGRLLSPRVTLPPRGREPVRGARRQRFSGQRFSLRLPAFALIIVLLLTLVWLFRSGGPLNSESHIQGRIEDIFGQAVVARVSVSGQNTESYSDAQGNYRLPYVPGRFEVTFEAEGFIDKSASWDLYERTTVLAAPVVMTPLPPGTGLWKTAEGRFRVVGSVRPVLTASADLGMITSPRRSVRIDSPPQTWCEDKPLIAFMDSPHSQAPFSVYPAAEDGHLWTEGLTGGEPQEGLIVQQPLSPRVWQINAGASSGRLALSAIAHQAIGAPPEFYYLQVVDCQGETR